MRESLRIQGWVVMSAQILWYDDHLAICDDENLVFFPPSFCDLKGRSRLGSIRVFSCFPLALVALERRLVLYSFSSDI